MNEIKCPKCGTVFQIDEQDYDSILKQVRDHEFEKQIQERERIFQEEKSNAIKLNTAELEKNHQLELAKKDSELLKLQGEIKNIKNETEKEFEKEINELILKNKDLESSIVLKDREYELEKKSTKEKYEIELKQKDTTIDYYKDLKAKQSTKMIGETLEQHCNAEFARIRSMFSPKTYFDKDNDARTGSKGDFIFRDYDDQGNEIVSIMFEMKNEADETASKHKNEDFFKELDKDRKEKNCEYAVLVSLLEIDNEVYNAGIVDVSYKYEKMYVIRPQFFVPIITLLRNASIKSLDYKKQLIQIQNQNIDITNFEKNLLTFKDGFSKNYNSAKKNFNTAIEEIDKAIKRLEAVKAALTTSENQLRIANDKAEDLTIKKLVRNNKTMAEMFGKANNDKELLQYANSIETVEPVVEEVSEVEEENNPVEEVSQKEDLSFDSDLLDL